MGEVHDRVSYVAEAATALSSSYTVLTCDATHEGVLLSPSVQLLNAHLEIDTIASSAASITWYLAADSSGDIPITPEVTDTIVTGKTTATDGGVARTVGVAFKPSTAGTVYVVAKTDTGTCNATARVWYKGH